MMSSAIDESVIADALQLSENGDRARQILKLQGHGLWRGDLAEMRGDSPRRPAAKQPGPSAYASEMIRQMARVRYIRAALDQLPPQVRQALQLHFNEHLPIEEIAEKLGISSGLAKELIKESVDRLRDGSLGGVETHQS
ncbi:MAG: Sigma-70, region 4 [Thermoanaerobaculia bacterium]|jgi:RNA polymerase sigma factor (sigma-70 family)|nr:Sigma-70, region 4 [Thermoanaerobaculia bacterium]